MSRGPCAGRPVAQQHVARRAHGAASTLDGRRRRRGFSLGEGWLAVSREILERGDIASYDGQATKELALLTLAVERPDSADPLIAELGDPEWLDWMHRNFISAEDVAELGRAKSYAVRLFDYAGTGRDQIAWVVDRLRGDPENRSAAITTFQPLTDTSYIPCVSLLDFWVRDGAVELVVYAHSLDFGKKAYGNLVELAHLSEHVAGELGRAGRRARRARQVGARLRARVGAHGRVVQRLERPRLSDRVLAPEQQLPLPADRVRHVLELEPVGVDRLELDPLDLVPVPHLDHGHAAVPGVVEEERALAADHLELVAPRQRGAAIELREHAALEPHRPHEHPVGAGLPDPRQPSQRLRFAGEQPRRR